MRSRVFTDMPNFSSLLEKYRRFWADFTAASEHFDKSSLMDTPRNLKQEIFSISALVDVNRGVCCFPKSTIISMVLQTLRACSPVADMFTSL